MARTFINRSPDYKDLDLDFFRAKTSNDVSMKVGEEAIKRSVRNLVMTNYYDRPFRPNVGGHVRKLLFDNVTPLTAGFIKDAISEVINNYEPRVKVTDVNVNLDPDRNGFNVLIQYIILNRQQPVTANFFLERIR